MIAAIHKHIQREEFDYQTCIATFFPIVRCYVHNFDDPACPQNASMTASWDAPSPRPSPA